MTTVGELVDALLQFDINLPVQVLHNSDNGHRIGVTFCEDHVELSDDGDCG